MQTREEHEARGGPASLVESAAIGALVAGLVEGLAVVSSDLSAALSHWGLWAAALPLLLVALIGYRLIVRAGRRLGLSSPDAEGWIEASLILAAGITTAIGFGVGALAAVAIDAVTRMELVETIVLVGAVALGLGLLASGVILVGPLARALGRLPRAPRRLLALALGGGPLLAVWLDARSLLGSHSTWPLTLGAIALLTALVWTRIGPRLPFTRPSAPLRAAIVTLALVVLGAVGARHYITDAPAREAVDGGQGLARLVGAAIDARFDDDGDGYSRLGGLDCDDGDAAVSPEAVEIPGNGVDEDCDGRDQAPAPAGVERTAHHARPAALAGQRLNVLLITIDTLRADRLSLYGHTRETSPSIDALGARGIVFERAYPVANQTRHSLPTLLAGRGLDFMRTDRRGTQVVFAPGNDFLFERLASAGHRTEAHLNRYFTTQLDLLGMGQGFEAIHTVDGDVRAPLSAPALTDATIAAFERDRQRPWALWVHYTEPHAPYEAHPDIDFGDAPIDRYDGEIKRVDQEVGRLLAALDARGFTDSTVVVLTSDHGEEFGEHGRQYHGQQLYEESIRVPLIVAGPHLEPRRIPEPVSLADVAPTIANLLGLTPAAGGGGISLVGRMTGGPPDPQRLVFVDRIQHDDRAQARQLAVIDGRWKLIYRAGKKSAKLYDLATDPGEQRPLTDKTDPRFQRLREAAQDRLARGRAAIRQDLIERRVSRRRPLSIQGPGHELAPGVALLGGTIEPLRGPRALYEARVWLEARDATRPDYRLRFTWTNAKGKTVARRDIRPLNGLYRTHEWREGEIVEVIVRAPIKRARPPFGLRLAVSARGKPQTTPVEAAYLPAEATRSP